MSKGAIFVFSWAGFLLPVIAFAVAALITRWLATWFGLRWFWQYLAVVVIWSTLNWCGELILNHIAQQVGPPQ